jgi:hypothetical protein
MKNNYYKQWSLDNNAFITISMQYRMWVWTWKCTVYLILVAKCLRKNNFGNLDVDGITTLKWVL